MTPLGTARTITQTDSDSISKRNCDMNEYLDQLTYEQLDELRFAVMNDSPASEFISDISAAINRKLFPVFEGVVVEGAPAFILQLAEVVG